MADVRVNCGCFMRLDIRHWEMLKAIADLGTLKNAASALGITQSALSHRLAEAERRLGSPLFDREGRQLRLAKAGIAMTQTALQVIPALQRAEHDFMQASTNAASVVRFGVAAYSCYHWLPVFMKHLDATTPAIQLELVASATQNPIMNLLEGAVDVVMAPGLSETPGIKSIPLFQDELVLVVPAHHHLASKAYIVAEDLLSEDYLTYSKTAQPGFEYERFIRPSGVVPHLVTVVEVTDAIIELISSGFGVSILSRWAVGSALKGGKIAALPLGKQGLSLDWYALVRASDATQSHSAKLAQLMAAWYAQKIGTTNPLPHD